MINLVYLNNADYQDGRIALKFPLLVTIKTFLA